MAIGKLSEVLAGSARASKIEDVTITADTSIDSLNKQFNVGALTTPITLTITAWENGQEIIVDDVDANITETNKVTLVPPTSKKISYVAGGTNYDMDTFEIDQAGGRVKGKVINDILEIEPMVVN